MKQVNSEVLYIKPGDTILLTFGSDYDLETIEKVGEQIANNFPDNKFLANIEGLITDIKIIKEDMPFVTGLTTVDDNPWDQEIRYREFKFNDYLY